jgi:hypothetical protein
MGSGQCKNCWGKGRSSRCGEGEGCVCVRVLVWGYMAVECGPRLWVVQVIKIVFGLSTSFWLSFLVSTPATSSNLPRSTLSLLDVYNSKISNSPYLPSPFDILPILTWEQLINF